MILQHQVKDQEKKMVKSELRLYLDEKDLKRLKEKASACGFEGHGAITFYIRKIANEPIIFLSQEILLLLNNDRSQIH